jgi:ribosome-binding factor A
MSHYSEKLPEELRHLAAQFLERESNRTSLITVTRVVLSENKKYATIFITVFPTDKEEAAVEFVRRQRTEFISYVSKNSKIGRLPTITFELDLGEKNRQRIDELSNQG